MRKFLTLCPTPVVSRNNPRPLRRQLFRHTTPEPVFVAEYRVTKSFVKTGSVNVLFG